MSYLDRVKPTYLENWPAALCRLSIAQVDIPLTLQEARALGSNIIELGEAFVECTAEQVAQQKAAGEQAHRKMRAKLTGKPFDESPIVFPKVEWRPGSIGGIEARVREALAKFPDGAFARLGSRSPKDAWSGHREGFKLLPGDPKPLRHFLDVSERIMEDLLLALKENYPPHIFVRQWLDIPAWSEFRCFMRDRQLVGISQYQYRDHYPEIAPLANTVAWHIETFFAQSFRPACHLSDVIFDVIFKTRKVGNERVSEVVLLEIDPFFEMTDPCLFDWRKGGDFDGSFRYLGNDKKVIRCERGCA